MTTTTFNTLVVSDLHLGEDLAACATAVTKRHIDMVEEQLAAFLRHYAHRRRDGRPWRLLINGDMVDFLAICVLPDSPFLEPGELDGEKDVPAPEDHTYGLARRPAAARAKMRAVIDRRPAFFRALARFLARGNRADIVCGNHDVELAWPGVQAVFRAAVATAWEGMPQASRAGAPSGAELAEAIAFHPWFFYEPGVLWAEHGHQYDECCSFEYCLNPVESSRDQIVTNVDTAVSRYVANGVENSDPHAQDDWSLRGYVSFAFGLGARGLGHAVRAYYSFSRSLLGAWRQHASLSDANRQRRDTHAARRRELAEAWDVSERTLRDLDDYHRRPVIQSLPRLARVLMLDKFVIICGTLAIALAAVGLLTLPWAAGTIAASLVCAWLLARWSSKGRVVDPAVSLGIVPERIVRRIDARFVLFGHTHEPVAQPIESGCTYFNTGTWVPSGKPGLLRAFTHVIVTHGETGPRAMLCQWRDGASREFTPEWQPASWTGSGVEPVSQPVAQQA